MKRPEFSPGELNFLTESPEALRALADRHSIWAVEAEAMDFLDSARHHERRQKYLLEVAEFVQTAHDLGEDVVFEGEPRFGM